MKYPSISAELIRLANDDQDEITSAFGTLAKLDSDAEREERLKKVYISCHRRAKRLEEILDVISLPTIENIGTAGCEAVATIAMHSYVDLMERVNKLLQGIYESDRQNVVAWCIPALCDRIEILKHRPQIFGTQWLVDKNGRPFLAQTVDFEAVNANRQKYDLPPVRKPVNLAKGAKRRPLGAGAATISDQRPLTENDFQHYSRYYLKSLIS